jgi:hypothetical protein
MLKFARLKRSHVALTTLALLLALDLGRSINARVGYAAPMSVWQPSRARTRITKNDGSFIIIGYPYDRTFKVSESITDEFIACVPTVLSPSLSRLRHCAVSPRGAACHSGFPTYCFSS